MHRIYANSGKEDKVRGLDSFRAMLEIEREGAMLWAPVALGTGVGIYFSLPFEPARLALLGLGLLAAAGLWFARAGRVGAGLAAMALLGVVVSALQTERVRAPVLPGELRGAVVGRVVAIDRSASNAHRITLDQVHLPGRGTVPERVRVSLAGPVADGVLEAGARVMMRAWLSRPNPPVEPGDFDFRRHAWFARIGAVGYTRDPVVLAAAQPVHSLGTRILALRLSLSRDIQARLPGAEGAFAAAILTGDRSAIDPRDMAALRASNLAHLLAISGLHMGLLTGFVFASLRMVLASVPALAVRLPVKKLAAAAGILCGAFYLVLSGATVATERAFIMAAVALGAVLLDRPAITLRAVALAALIVLLRNPVSLLGPGFQMSFAATAGLVAVYGRLRRIQLRDWMRGRYWAPVRWAAALALTSGVAGLATAPFSAFHFNAISRLGYLANLAAVPAMGFLVMPAAVVAGVLAPFGAEGPAMVAMGLGISHILSVAHSIGASEWSVIRVPAATPATLPLIALGACVLVLARSRLAVSGLLLLAAGGFAWWATPRPALLVSADGRMLGLLGEEGRALSAARGNGFAAKIWLENDGSRPDQREAFSRAAFREDGPILRGKLDAAFEVAWTRQKELGAGMCVSDVVLIAPAAESRPIGECVYLGPAELKERGAHAFRVQRDGTLVVDTVLNPNTSRPWGH